MDESIIKKWFDLLDNDDFDVAEQYYVDNMIPSIVNRILDATRINVIYDVLISLVGFTPEVNVIAYKLIRPKKFILFCSKETIHQADKIIKYCKLSLKQVEIVEFQYEDVFLNDIYFKLRCFIDSNSWATNYLFDITGGKKIMGNQLSIAAYIMNQNLGKSADICYIDFEKYLPKYRKPDPNTIILSIQTDIISTAQKILNPNMEDAKSEDRNGEIVINPVFHGRFDKLIKNSVLVIMPFSEVWSDRIYLSIKKICEKEGFTISRADKIYGSQVMEDTWEGIFKSEIIIADITNNNANVLYELGIVHTLGKPIVLLSQNKDVPFDLKPHRCLLYEDNIDGNKKLETELPKYLLSRKLASDGYNI
jgi:hypothetical protein